MNQPMEPHSHESEQGVLGGIMIASRNGDHDRITAATKLVKAESFYSSIHQTIYRAIQRLLRDGASVDLLALEANMDRHGELERVGGIAYLSEIVKVTPSAANIVYHAKLVREHAVRRYAMRKVTDALEMLSQKTSEGLDDQMAAVQGLLAEITDYANSGRTTGFRHIRDFASTWLDEIEARTANPTANAGYTSGIESLDKILWPKLIRRGSLVVIGARPKMGKTAFLLRILLHFAIHHKLPVGMFSLEMPGMELWERMVSQESRVNSDRFYTGMDDADFGRVSAAMAPIINSNLMVCDDAKVSLATVMSEARKLKAKHGKVGCIAVDYLTLMAAEKADRNDLAYGMITKGLKSLAKELDCPVFLLTQLNRQLESRSDKRPMPSDSRDTGQIEQDCDLWIGLYREGVYNKELSPGLAGVTEAIVRLNRHGKSGTAHMNLVNGAFYDADQKQIGQMAMADNQSTDREDY